MQTIHGYTLDEANWKTKGGNGQCNIATKDGKKYFIKKLPAPKYPPDIITGQFRELEIEKCNNWLKYRRRVLQAIPGTGTGTTVKPIEYFREGTTYYEVANLVEIDSIPYTEIYKENKETKARVMLTVAMALNDLHKHGLVHGDLDPNNVLIAHSTGGRLITKLIDFTDAFFVDDIPETIMSKEYWWSPEVALYNKEASAEKETNQWKELISGKADVFSLGIVFHQFCAPNGEGPACKASQPYQELFTYGQKPQINPNIEPEFRELISDMLEFMPDNRPSMAEVHARLRNLLNGDTSSYVVSFDTKGGTPIAPQKVVNRKTAVTPANPTRNGYQFDGWYKDSSCTARFDFSAPITSNATVFAKWKPVPKQAPEVYRVTFAINGGSSIESQTVEKGKTAVTPANPTRNGCQFDGWYKDSSCTVHFDFSAPITSDVTVFARWKSEGGSNSLRVGPKVRAARLHERNPQKVVLEFLDGRTQIMDLPLALRQGYVSMN